jgi:co-chaperonin GroES (HSP10)
MKGEAMPAALMLHELDPREDILKRAGDLSHIDVFGSDILCAIYMRPNKTKSGIWLSDATAAEDAYQGKVFLILKMGPHAFVDEEGTKFRDIKEGDWVVARSSDGWAVTLNPAAASTSKDTIPCRVITDINVRLRVESPDAIY